MTHRRTTFVIGLAACLALAGAARARQTSLSLSGRVVFQTAAAPSPKRPAPLPRFTARLYFPKEANRPTIVTYTDPVGNFKFDRLNAGRYLLEIYQGNEMVFQKALTVDNNLPQPLVVALRPRA
jgi:hypothetical protein